MNFDYELVGQNAGSYVGCSPYRIDMGPYASMNARAKDLRKEDDAAGRYSIVYFVRKVDVVLESW